jgi:TonB-dependent starch-binding outer membrane protein SusC
MSYRTWSSAGRRWPRFASSILALSVLLVFLPSSAFGQDTGTIEGTIVEANTERPLSAVQVTVPGTNRGALSNAEGFFRVTGVPAGQHEVQAQRIGYSTTRETVTVQAGATVSLSLTLRQTAVALDEMVVTGTPGGSQRRALGNAVSSINAAEITERVSNVTVSELLRAKTPGLTIIGGSGTAGAGTNIRIRGANSLLGGNQPIFYVDGVRMSASRMGNFLASCCNADNQQNANLLSMINPDDIESIEVIKGPAAATLYGAEAAAGVIQIITKRGAAGQQGLQWNARAGVGQTEWGAERYTNYLVCTEARIANTAVYPGCTGQTPGSLISSQPLSDPDALRTGGLRQFGLSVRGGGDGYSFYVSGDTDDEAGIFHNNFSNRRSARANFTFFPTDELDFTVNLGYNRQHVRLPLQGESAQSIMFSAALSEPGRVYPGTGGLGWWIMTPDLSNRFDNQTRAEQTILGVTANYRPFDWFSNRITVGLDNNTRTAELFYPPNDPMRYGPAEGQINRRVPSTHVYTADYAGTVSTDFTPSLASAFSFGMQLNVTQHETISASGLGLGSDATRTVAAAAVTTGSQSFSESRTLGFFVQEQLAWENRLFLTGAVRMDNSSVFGADIQRIFYPKLMTSWVLSEEPFMAGRLPDMDNLRLRAAWGQAGQAPSAYAAQRTYASSVVTLADGQTVPALAASAFGNPDLEPERGDELELGFDASFFDDRLGLELTWYNQRMRNGLLSVSIPPSSGFSGSILENLLETQNRGWEVMLTGVPVETPAVSWSTSLNFSTNNNKLISFGDDRDPVRFGLYNPVQQHRPGYPLGGFWGREILRDADGFPQIDENNRPQFGDSTFIGPSTPARQAGFGNTFTILRNLQLYALLDYAGGHYQFNVPDWRRAFLGISWDVVDPDADPRDVALMRAGFGGASPNTVPEPWIQPADFLKLRDISLSYTLPSRFTAPLGADLMRLVLAGHNMATLWTRYGGLDPEINLHGDATFLRTDGFTVPSTRRISASLNVNF